MNTANPQEDQDFLAALFPPPVGTYATMTAEQVHAELAQAYRDKRSLAATHGPREASRRSRKLDAHIGFLMSARYHLERSES